MKTFVKNVGMVGFANAMIYVKNFALFVVLTKMLGAFNFGVWSQILASLRLLTPFAFLGLATAMIRFLAGEADKNTLQETFYSMIFTIAGVSVIIAFPFFIFSNSIAATFMKDIQVSYLIKIVAVFFPTYILCEFSYLYFQAVIQIKKYVLFIIVTNMLEVVFALLAIYFGFGLLGPLMALMGIHLLVFICMMFQIVKDIGFKWPAFSNLTAFLAFSLPLLPLGFSNWIVASSDRYLIGFFLQPKAVGIYSASYTLSSIILFLAVPISTVFYPTISGLWNMQEKETMKKCISYTIKYLLIGILPFAGIIVSLGKSLLIIFSTREFVVGNFLIAIIIFGLIFYALSLLSIHILTVFKKTRFVLASYTLAALANFIFNLILIPKIGILGAAIATAISYCALFDVVLLKVQRFISFEIELVEIFKAVIIAFIISIALFFINPVNFTSVFIAIFMMFACYAILIVATKAVTKNEILVFMDLFTCRKKQDA